MCGVAGIIGLRAGEGRVERMLDVMRHRGPDDAGIWANRNNNVELGHQRLSIIDLSSGGHQPHISPDGRFVLVYNGEIYNYPELRPELEGLGWQFRTASDTEVLLAGLVLKGSSFINQTVGMFAFALWDNDKKSLLLGRDRVGVKPLYYAHIPGRMFAFSSELKSLLTLKEIPRQIDCEALQVFLALRYVPGPRTMVAGIRKFPQAHWALFQNDQLEFTRYWDISFHAESRSKPWVDEEVEERFGTLLRDAVRLRLRADVPCGAFLSGGVDSTVIVGLMSELNTKPVHTYSIGFGTTHDELEEARITASYFGTQHTSMRLEAKDLERLPELVRYLDEPFSDPIALAMFILAEKAKRDVKVILTGEGADELLAGYVHHPHLMAVQNHARRLPQGVLNSAAWIAGHAPISWIDKAFDYPASVGEAGRVRLANFIRTAKDPIKNYLTYISLFNDTGRSEILSAQYKFADHNDFASTFPGIGSGHTGLMDILESEYKTWLPDNILFKQDKTLMAHSLEGRVPFCDHRLVEFTSHLPMRYKLGRGMNKVLLRKTAARFFPNKPISKSKKAFLVPHDGEIGKAQLQLARTVLTDPQTRIHGIFEPQGVQKLLNHYHESPLVIGKQLMALTMMELWVEHVLKG